MSEERRPMPEISSAHAKRILARWPKPSEIRLADVYDIPHDHAEFIDGCFRCDLSRNEL